jgi:hypothetical protein
MKFLNGFGVALILATIGSPLHAEGEWRENSVKLLFTYNGDISCTWHRKIWVETVNNLLESCNLMPGEVIKASNRMPSKINFDNNDGILDILEDNQAAIILAMQSVHAQDAYSSVCSFGGVIEAVLRDGDTLRYSTGIHTTYLYSTKYGREYNKKYDAVIEDYISNLCRNGN